MVVGAVLLSLCPTVRLSAQVSLSLSAGARYSSALVKDSIAADRITVRPALAPTLGVAARTPLGPRTAAEASLEASTSHLERHVPGEPPQDLGRVTTVTFALAVERALAGPLQGRAGVGWVKYLPAQETGIFRLGSGSLMWLVTAGARYEPPFAARRGLALEARYDVHRFATAALRSAGFAESRTVHRVTVLLRADPGRLF